MKEINKKNFCKMFMNIIAIVTCKIERRRNEFKDAYNPLDGRVDYEKAKSVIYSYLYCYLEYYYLQKKYDKIVDFYKTRDYSYLTNKTFKRNFWKDLLDNKNITLEDVKDYMKSLKEENIEKEEELCLKK